MKPDRREFLAGALGAAPLFVPAKAWGANDRPAYGVIGTGGRGRYVSALFQKVGAECVALCDVHQPHLDLARKDAPQARTFVDSNELLALKGVDCVLIATPDHQHRPNLLAALAAGKDVYLEKPMSHSLEESRLMVEAVRQTDRIVQIGMQRRTAPLISRAKALIDGGALGRISLVSPMWNWNVSKPLDNSPLEGKLDWQRFLGPAPERDLEPMRFRSWRLFWDYSGGNMTDQGTHLMDVTQWLTNTTHTLSAVCFGQVQKSAGGEAPDVFSAVFEYPQHMVQWTLDYCNSYQNGWSLTFRGDEGTLVIDDEGFLLYREPWRETKNREPAQVVKQGLFVEPHVRNFLDCMKSRQQPAAPVEVGASAVCGPHLANIAFQKQRQARLGPDGEVSF